MLMFNCCRKGDPFQGMKVGSCLTLGNELSEETHVLTKEILLGSCIWAESNRVREPRRTALPRGSQFQGFTVMGLIPGCLANHSDSESFLLTNLDSILKTRDITLLTKVHLVKAMIFPVVTYGCKSWAIKKAECQRIDAFELWSWRRLLKVPWTARRSNQSILKEISPEYWLEGWCWSSNILAPDAKIWLIEKDPDAGKDWRQEKGTTEDEKAGWHHQLTGHEFEQAAGDSEGQGILAFCSPRGCKESVTTEQLNNSNDLIWIEN